MLRDRDLDPIAIIKLLEKVCKKIPTDVDLKTWTIASNPAAKMAFLKPTIELHIDKRFELMWLWFASVVGRSNYQFTCGARVQQGEKATTYTVSYGAYAFTIAEHACHSSSLSSLWAHAPDGKVYDFLRGSYSCTEENATIHLPVSVNGCDSLIDGFSKSGNKLRGDIERFVNLVAQKPVPPQVAMHQFAVRFIYWVGKAIKNVDSKSQDMKRLEQGAALPIYAARGQALLQLVESGLFGDLMVGVPLMVDEKDPLRDTLYPARIKVMQAGQEAEVGVGGMLLQLERSILGTRARPANFHRLLMLRVLEAARTRFRLKAFQTYFGTTIDQLRETLGLTVVNGQEEWDKTPNDALRLIGNHSDELTVAVRGVETSLDDLATIEEAHAWEMFVAFLKRPKMPSDTDLQKGLVAAGVTSWYSQRQMGRLRFGEIKYVPGWLSPHLARLVQVPEGAMTYKTSLTS